MTVDINHLLCLRRRKPKMRNDWLLHIIYNFCECWFKLFFSGDLLNKAEFYWFKILTILTTSRYKPIITIKIYIHFNFLLRNFMSTKQIALKWVSRHKSWSLRVHKSGKWLIIKDENHSSFAQVFERDEIERRK